MININYIIYNYTLFKLPCLGPLSKGGRGTLTSRLLPQLTVMHT